MDSEDLSLWQHELDSWLAPFLDKLGDKRRRHWAPLYLKGLLGSADRKSVQPMAEQVAPGDAWQLHHFVADSCWPTEPLEAVLVQQADALVGGDASLLIIDDTTLLKQGKHSVGVARQYSGAAGKRANCQTLVSLTLAQGEVPVPIALRLFLPDDWVVDGQRCRRAGVPEQRILGKSKMEIALEELDRVRAQGARFGYVVADAGYGMSGAFRQALSNRGLLWAVGIPKTQKVYSSEVEMFPPRAKGPGAIPKHPWPSEEARSVEQVLSTFPKRSWRKVVWRQGSKEPLACRFFAVRIRVADGAVISGNKHAPGEELWLIGEWRSTGERKYYLSNLSVKTRLKRLAAIIKARWSCEQAHQQMKEELGLDHFEGRSWNGLHHHALMVMIAFGFLQHLRLQHVQRSGEKNKRATTKPELAGGAEVHPEELLSEDASAMSALPSTVHHRTKNLILSK